MIRKFYLISYDIMIYHVLLMSLVSEIISNSCHVKVTGQGCLSGVAISFERDCCHFQLLATICTIIMYKTIPVSYISCYVL